MLRKGKLYDVTPSERKKQKLEKYISNHAVKGVCNCKKKCNKKIDSLCQKIINNQDWALSREMQNAYLMTCVKKLVKGRNITGDESSRRTNTYK